MIPPMEVRQALSHIIEIRQALLGTQIYRGHRPATIATTGVLAALTPFFLDKLPLPTATSWLLVGIVCFLVVGGEMAHDYYYSFGSTQKRLARHVLSQFTPPLFMGAALSWMWCNSPDLPMAPLPALWCLFYGLGLFAARPHLGRGVGWVALFFTLAGLALLSPSGQATNFSAMSLIFGFGQLFLALVLHWNLPRGGDNE